MSAASARRPPNLPGAAAWTSAALMVFFVTAPCTISVRSEPPTGSCSSPALYSEGREIMKKHTLLLPLNEQRIEVPRKCQTEPRKLCDRATAVDRLARKAGGYTVGTRGRGLEPGWSIYRGLHRRVSESVPRAPPRALRQVEAQRSTKMSLGGRPNSTDCLFWVCYNHMPKRDFRWRGGRECSREGAFCRGFFMWS
jgi:hypothetical protein